MIIRQSTAITVPLGPFLDEVDGRATEAALTITQPDIRLSKNGAAFAQKNAAQTLTHMENGYYGLALNATDTDTVGRLRVHCNETGALPVWEEFQVIEEAVYDAFFAAAAGMAVTLAANAVSAAAIATGAIDADALAANAITAAKVADGTIDAATFAAGAINAAAIANGTIDAATFAANAVDAAALATDAVNEIARAILPQTNTALNNITFYMLDSGDGFTAKTGLTVTGQRSIDAGALVAVGGTITEISDGLYQFDAVAADMNGTTITFVFSATGAVDTPVTISRLAA